MIFGDKSEFAIEAHHEKFGEKDSHVFGRMCCWCEDEMLGDINEPTCILGVTAGILESVLERCSELNDPEMAILNDAEAYAFLDHKIYGDDDRTLEQVEADSEAYFKYEFLTSGGESFDNSKSFIIADNFYFRILFFNYDLQKNVFSRVSKKQLLSAIKGFLAWHQARLTKLTSAGM